MIDTIANADMRLVVILVGLAALPVLLRWPPALGRWLSANEFAAPWWVSFFLLGLAALSGIAASFHIRKLLEVTTQAAPAQATVGAFLGWLLGFISEGISGSLLVRAHAQAAGVSVIVLTLCMVLVYRQRYSIFAMHIKARRGEDAVPRRVVVMGLSLEGPRPGKDAEAVKSEVAAFAAAASALDLEAVSAPAPELRFPWQQNLRVLKHHLLQDLPQPGLVRRAWRWVARRPRPESRRVVVVVPSRESMAHAEEFVAVAKACAANSGRFDVQFKIWPRAVDYNDLKALRGELLEVVRMLQGKAVAARLDEISIDTTPGMKLVSIAGAAVTFASPLEFTYVETTPPNAVVAFDVRAGFRKPYEL